MGATTAAELPKDEGDTKVRAAQRVRKQRLGMSFISYLITFALVCICWYQHLISLGVLAHFLISVLIINLFFLSVFQSNLNLRAKDPSLTAAQMVLSLLPALYVMYHLDAGQARAVFMLIAIVPALYGILALNTRQFLSVGLFYIGLYGIMVAILYWQRPKVPNNTLELLQMIAMILVVGQISVIGGFINGLRSKLRKRNQELTATMAELNTALEKIQYMAKRDALTGLFNRRYLFDMLSQEANRQSRASGPFSVCILDIDFFKKVNDTHGHLAGDEVLHGLAENVLESLRNIDCFGRYGGEEFLLILPQTPLDGAEVKAERVRRKVESLRFPNIAESFKVTVSIGVAEYQDGESPEETISRADQALYKAKEQGRNRVIVAREDTGA
jgi:diguanylate cyclase (GGDEF)-like protein